MRRLIIAQWHITALADPKHDEHDQVVTSVDGHFRPDSLDANAVNRELRCVRNMGGSVSKEDIAGLHPNRG